MWYTRNPRDEFLQNLITRIQLGDIPALVEFLELNPHAEALYEVHKKLLRTLYSEDGIDNLALAGIYDLTKLLFGTDAANYMNLMVRGNNNFYLDNERFPEVCKKLNIQYVCSVCNNEIEGPEDILFCNLCDRFFCRNVHYRSDLEESQPCMAPILAAGLPTSGPQARYRDTECYTCYKKIFSKPRY